MILTPNLRALEAQRLTEAIGQLTGLIEAPAIYADADATAGKYFLYHDPAKHEPAATTIARLTTEYRVPAPLVGYLAGVAFGVRMGRRFRLTAAVNRRSLSDDYAALTVAHRQDAATYIRRLLNLQTARPARVRFSAVAAKADLASARRWSSHRKGA